MSISYRGVKIKKRGNILLLAILGVTEVVFTILLIISLSSNFLFPQRTSATGVPANLSYQGRLTDLVGATLGGATGTNYCFRFSIYDAASGGTKRWPAGTPATTTVKVKDGVFNTALGVDSLSTFDFASTSWGANNLYLQVDINATPTTCGGAWESLDVRQRVDAVAYARTAEGVYSSLLKAPTGGSTVQIGIGSGQNPIVSLSLDQKNIDDTVGASCTSGQMWYTAANKNRFRVCQGSAIRDMIDGILVRDDSADIGRASVALDFTGAGVSVSKGAGASSGVININIPFGGIAVNGGAAISSGIVVFSSTGNVTFGMNGSTITANAPAAGGGATLNNFYWPPGVMQSAMAISGGTGRYASYVPFYLDQNLTATRAAIMVSFIGGASTTNTTVRSNALTLQIGIFTRGIGASTGSIYGATTAQQTYSWSWNGTTNTTMIAALSGWRRISVPISINATPGDYWYGVWMSQANTVSGSGAATSVAIGPYSSALVFSGNIGLTSNSSRQVVLGAGVYSNTTTGALVTSLAISNIKSSTAGWNAQPWILFTNFDLN